MKSTELTGFGTSVLLARDDGAAEAIIIGVLFVVILVALITVFVIGTRRAKKGKDD